MTAIIIEIKQTGTGLPPDDASGISLNSTVTWVRVGIRGNSCGPWQPSPWRPLVQTQGKLLAAIREALKETP